MDLCFRFYFSIERVCRSWRIFDEMPKFFSWFKLAARRLGVSKRTREGGLAK